MIEPLEGVPSGVLGFEAIGEVEASDSIGVLVPAVEAAAEESPAPLTLCDRSSGDRPRRRLGRPPTEHDPGRRGRSAPALAPGAGGARAARIGRYLAWLEAERGLTFADYDELWRWSISDLDGFWTSIWEYFDVSGGPAPRPAAR